MVSHQAIGVKLIMGDIPKPIEKGDKIFEILFIKKNLLPIHTT